MVMDKHVCPYGLKAKDLLRRKGYEVEDRWLTSKKETEAFKAKHDVRTTPQIFIANERIGGYDDLRRHLGKKVPDAKATSYKPVIALFSITLLMALAVSFTVYGTPFTMNYDLLAKRWVPYSYVYPFAEGFAGILMIGGIMTWLSVPVALFIGVIGAVSVFKAVYIDRRELKCACVGGSSNVPLGFVSLTENLMMIAMAVWMTLTAFNH